MVGIFYVFVVVVNKSQDKTKTKNVLVQLSILSQPDHGSQLPANIRSEDGNLKT